jgi:phosphoribosylaminoimidazole-succinocarboxamide synthase
VQEQLIYEGKAKKLFKTGKDTRTSSRISGSGNSFEWIEERCGFAGKGEL